MDTTRIEIELLRLRIGRLRKVRGWTQAELASRAAINQADLSRLESGRRIFAGHVERCAEALGVPLEDLVGVHRPAAARKNDRPSVVTAGELLEEAT